MLAPEAARQEPGGFRPDRQEPEPPHTPPMPPAPVPRPTDPRLLLARIDTPTPPPAGTTTDEAAVKPDRSRPAPRPAARGTAGSSSAPRRSLRHSAQARITAQRLREAYAASSPF